MQVESRRRVLGADSSSSGKERVRVQIASSAGLEKQVTFDFYIDFVIELI